MRASCAGLRAPCVHRMRSWRRRLGADNVIGLQGRDGYRASWAGVASWACSVGKGSRAELGYALAERAAAAGAGPVQQLAAAGWAGGERRKGLGLLAFFYFVSFFFSISKS